MIQDFGGDLHQVYEHWQKENLLELRVQCEYRFWLLQEYRHRASLTQRDNFLSMSKTSGLKFCIRAVMSMMIGLVNQVELHGISCSTLSSLPHAVLV